MADAQDLQAQIENLTQEKNALLEELESAYLGMEELVESAEHEKEITYQALRDRNQDLQKRLEELEQANKDLTEAQQLLVRSERLAAMGEMAAAIVHELKNPLNVMLGRLELMKLDNRSVTEDDLDAFHRSTVYLAKLTENILGFSRQHHGVAELLILDDLIQAVVSFVKPLYKGVEIELEINQETPLVHIDSSKVEQVIMNLVLNAIDAMEKQGALYLTTGRGSIGEGIVRAERDGRGWVLAGHGTDKNKEFAYVTVRDSGPGILEAHLPRVFEAFFTTKEKGKGTGLGLSIVRTIVEEWGGDILLDSKKGEGAQFQVFVPIAPSEL